MQVKNDIKEEETRIESETQTEPKKLKQLQTNVNRC
jgi:hypothetical protein